MVWSGRKTIFFWKCKNKPISEYGHFSFIVICFQRIEIKNKIRRERNKTNFTPLNNFKRGNFVIRLEFLFGQHFYFCLFSWILRHGHRVSTVFFLVMTRCKWSENIEIFEYIAEYMAIGTFCVKIDFSITLVRVHSLPINCFIWNFLFFFSEHQLMFIE